MSANGKKKPGRPEGCGKRGGQTYHGKCDVRLTKEYDNMLNRLADRYGISRSDVMRTALKELADYNGLKDD